MNKKSIAVLVSAGILAGVFSSFLSGCGKQPNSEKLQIVASDFVLYDFARTIGGDDVEVTMLIKPGADSHNYEPTPANMIDLIDADVVLYIGGESEGWLEVMMNAEAPKGKTLALMEVVELLEEEEISLSKESEDANETGHSHESGHTHEAGHSNEDEEIEYDEHIWTSPINAIAMVEAIADTLSEVDPEHQADYEARTKAYVSELETLDATLREVVNHAERRELVMADRFPLLYFVREYNLDYVAAFPGCSASTEVNAKEVAALIDHVNEEQLPVVLHLELSTEQLCNTVAEETGAEAMQFNACHNISEQDFTAGKTYLDFMNANVIVLKEALGYDDDSM